MLTFTVSKRVVASSVSLDMVEVGGSNPPGPTKTKRASRQRGFFIFGDSGWVRPPKAVRQNATAGAFGTERPWREAHWDETGSSLFRVVRLVLPNIKEPARRGSLCPRKR